MRKPVIGILTLFFLILASSPALPQLPCGITHTNPGTHELIRRNISLSALYGGQISAGFPAVGAGLGSASRRRSLVSIVLMPPPATLPTAR